MAYSYKEFANEIHAPEQRPDPQFKDIVHAIRVLMTPPPTGFKCRIGFRPLPANEI